MNRATAVDGAAGEELRPRARFARLLLAHALLFAASPGVAGGDGSLALALAGVALWGAAARRPGRLAPLAEGLAGTLGAAPLWWIAYVSWPALVAWTAPGFGLYAALAGIALRRLARRAPLPLAVALAWGLWETARTLAPPPLGVSWLRLGHEAHAHAWLAGSARVFGVGGLSWCLALAAGALAELSRARRATAGALAALALGLGLPAALSAATRAPRTEDGPRVLLVQPGIPQERKRSAGSADELFSTGLAATASGLARAEGPLDLVCWAETMLPLWLGSADLRSALEAGLGRGHWMGEDEPPWEPEDADLLAERERHWVGRTLLGAGAAGRGGLLPAGASFLAGAIGVHPEDGRLARTNSAFLWSPDGTRQPPVAKRHPVPGAESMLGLERFAPVRDLCERIVGYVPSFSPGEGSNLLHLTARDGRAFAISVGVCFDNAFLDLFADGAREGADLHLVLSNEAWYLDSCELDQMLAFSRMIAIATGRSFVRATNSGVSAVFGPDGAELARLVVGGRDRQVAGALEATVPVPIAPDRAPTPFVRARRLWLGLWIGAPCLLMLLPARGRNRPPRTS